jgi:predicted tellurium resistance membrane protein TerC
MVTILFAEFIMSLNNILAVSGLALGDIPILAISLLLGVVILLVGGAIVARLISDIPWLLDVAAIVLGCTAFAMIARDQIISGFLSALLPGSTSALACFRLGQ